MTDNKSCEDIKRCEIKRPLFTPITSSTSTPVLNSRDKILTVTDKGVQVNMDCDADEDPAHNKKYWQNLAGHRGAREEYLKYDFRELLGQHGQLKCNYKLMSDALHAAKQQIAELKANRCRCQKTIDQPRSIRGLCP